MRLGIVSGARQGVIAAVAATVLVGAASWFVLRSEAAKQVAASRTLVTQRLGAVQAGVEAALGTRLALLRSLSALVAVEPNLGQDAFALFARDLIESLPAVRSVQLARDNRISHVYPDKGPLDLTGLRLPEGLPVEQVAAVRQVLATGQPVLSGPLPLLQGGTGFILRARVVTGALAGTELPWGLATVLLDDAALFREAIPPEARNLVRQAKPGEGECMEC